MQKVTETEDTTNVAQLKVQRPGKTTRDRKDGALARRMSNLALRAGWQNENRGKTNPSPFPAHTCKGNGNGAVPTKYGPGRQRSGKSLPEGIPRKPSRQQLKQAA